MKGAVTDLAAALRILLPARDILEGRVDEPAPPEWCERRGWSGFLLALDDGEVARCEAEGFAARAAELPGVPDELRAFAAAITEATRLPRLEEEERAPASGALRAVGERKRRQLPALLGAVARMAESSARIVDVGSGSGHFTRLAADLFEREAVGLERDPGRVAAAEARAREEPGSAARFVTIDACREPLELAPDDLAVGLHACGALGDRLARAAAEAGCRLALVSCCLQKIEGPERAPLSRAGEALSLRRDTLGLANLTAQAQGVEVGIEATMEARLSRFALLRLLRERGIEVAPGEEMRGINRRRARKGLGDIAALALAARGLPPPSAAELARHERDGRLAYGIVRRLSLPRSMLARLVEAAVVLDRAAALEESGLAVRVAAAFDRAASPRNLAIFASRSAADLPRASG